MYIIMQNEKKSKIPIPEICFWFLKNLTDAFLKSEIVGAVSDLTENCHFQNRFLNTTKFTKKSKVIIISVF